MADFVNSFLLHSEPHKLPLVSTGNQYLRINWSCFGQCRQGRSQRNHITLAVRTRPCLNHFAYQTNQTAYQFKQGLPGTYLCHEMTQKLLFELAKRSLLGGRDA